VVSADFNQDGIADLALITPEAQVVVLLGAESGLYRRSFSVDLPRQGWSLYAADLDGDGVVDLAVAHPDRGGISMFHGRGDGTFVPAGDQWPKQPTLWSLTAREIEVARLAASGLTCAEIGARLGIGRRTVETHVAAIRSKLELRHKRQLVRHGTPKP